MVKKTEQEGIIRGTHSDGWQEVGTDKGTKKEQDSEKDRVRSENMGCLQQCIGERLKWIGTWKKRRTVKKQSKKQEYSALTAMYWQEVGMDKGTKKVRDSEKKKKNRARSKNAGHPQVGERLGWTGARKK